MLTGTKIKTEIDMGNIKIEPYNQSQLNPNSYNLKLHPDMKAYQMAFDLSLAEMLFMGTPKREYLDSKKVNPTINIQIPEDGYVLQPGILYIARTEEVVGSDKFIPCISGRSSIARLGISVHVTAGFGDVGFFGSFTLEITVTHPVKVYPHMEICQLYFETPEGPTDIQYSGKYLGQVEATASKMYEDFDK